MPLNLLLYPAARRRGHALSAARRLASSVARHLRRAHPIESTSLRLEPLLAAHAEEMFRAMSAAAIYDYMPARPPASPSALRKRYAHLEKGCSADGSERWLNWVVRLKSRECVGFVQTTIYPALSADFAFAFAPTHWGRGIAYEACGAALSCLRHDFDVRILFATVDPRNVRSIRLLERLGFVGVQSARYPHGELAADDRVFMFASD
jgi:[ribosomal protein S5]-alanine N-acetyltransferase